MHGGRQFGRGSGRKGVHTEVSASFIAPLIGLLGSSLIDNDANRLPRLGWFGMARGMFKEATAFNIGAVERH
jgi:hypothetical protein